MNKECRSCRYEIGTLTNKFCGSCDSPFGGSNVDADHKCDYYHFYLLDYPDELDVYCHLITGVNHGTQKI